MDSISSFLKNDDGSIQYTVSKDGVEAFSQKITPGADADFKTPDGNMAKVFYELKGDSLESVITFPDGNKLHLDRIFEGNTMKQVSVLKIICERFPVISINYIYLPTEYQSNETESVKKYLLNICDETFTVYFRNRKSLVELLDEFI